MVPVGFVRRVCNRPVVISTLCDFLFSSMFEVLERLPSRLGIADAAAWRILESLKGEAKLSSRMTNMDQGKWFLSRSQLFKNEKGLQINLPRNFGWWVELYGVGKSRNWKVGAGTKDYWERFKQAKNIGALFWWSSRQVTRNLRLFGGEIVTFGVFAIFGAQILEVDTQLELV